jgi:hypothetical protein
MAIYFDDSRFRGATQSALMDAGARSLRVLYAADIWGGAGSAQDAGSWQFTAPVNVSLLRAAVNREPTPTHVVIDWEPGEDARRLSTEPGVRWPHQTLDVLADRRRQLHGLTHAVAATDVLVSHWVIVGNCWDAPPREPLGDLSDVEVARLAAIRQLPVPGDFIVASEYDAARRYTVPNAGNVDGGRLVAALWRYLAWLRAASRVARDADQRRAMVFITTHHLEPVPGSPDHLPRPEHVLVEMLKLVRDFGHDAALWRHGALGFDREDERARLAAVVTQALDGRPSAVVSQPLEMAERYRAQYGLKMPLFAGDVLGESGWDS